MFLAQNILHMTQSAAFADQYNMACPGLPSKTIWGTWSANIRGFIVAIEENTCPGHLESQMRLIVLEDMSFGSVGGTDVPEQGWDRPSYPP